MDVYSALSPDLTSTRYLGLSPLRLTGAPGRRTLRRSTVSLVHSTLLVAVYLASLVASLGADAVAAANVNLQYSVSSWEMIYELVLATYLVVASCLTAPALARHHCSVHLIDRSLRTGDVAVPWTTLRRDAVRRLAVSVAACGVAVLGTACLVALSPEMSFSRLVFVFYAVFFSVKFVTYGFVSAYHTNVAVAAGLFVAINDKMDEMLRAPVDDEFKMAMVVKCLQKNHFRACGVVDGVNALYSVRVLFYVGSVFGELIIGLNNCFNSVVMVMAGELPEGTQAVAALQIGFSLYVVAIFVAQLARVCWACERCCREARSTGLQVHKMLLDPRFELCHPRLESFSLQLIQRQVYFSGGGFFPINAALLSQIVGGVTSFLVILIQFQLAAIKAPNASNTTV